MMDPGTPIVAFVPNPRSEQERFMSAPSRRPEIRRRRTRKEKIQKLRTRLKAAGNEAERTQIAGKLLRLSRNSPGLPLLKS